MNPKHCISVELAKQLKKTGWTKETEFSFCDVADKRFGREENEQFMLYDKDTAGNRRRNTEGKDIQYFAPLATELLEELPRGVKSDGLVIKTDLDEFFDEFFKVYYGLTAFIAQPGLPNALAKMWLYLKEEGSLGEEK